MANIKKTHTLEECEGIIRYLQNGSYSLPQLSIIKEYNGVNTYKVKVSPYYYGIIEFRMTSINILYHTLKEIQSVCYN